MIGPRTRMASDPIGGGMVHPPWPRSGEAGMACTPRAGRESRVRCTVPRSRATVMPEGGRAKRRSRARRNVAGARHVRSAWRRQRGGSHREPARHFLPSLGKVLPRPRSLRAGIITGHARPHPRRPRRPASGVGGSVSDSGVRLKAGCGARGIRAIRAKTHDFMRMQNQQRSVLLSQIPV